MYSYVLHEKVQNFLDIVLGKRSISANTALRLGRYFGTSAQVWMNLQNHYDLGVASDKLENRLKIEVKVLKTKSSIH